MVQQTSKEQGAGSAPTPTGSAYPLIDCWITFESQNKLLDHRIVRPRRTDRPGIGPKAMFRAGVRQIGRASSCFSYSRKYSNRQFSCFTQVLHGVNMAGTIGGRSGDRIPGVKCGGAHGSNEAPVRRKTDWRSIGTDFSGRRGVGWGSI